MRLRAVIVAGIVASLPVSVSPPAAAHGAAPRMTLRIGTTLEGNLFTSGTAEGRFTLDLNAASDSGKFTWKYSYGDLSRTERGQGFRPGERTETLKGKRGTLVIHTIGRQYPVGVENPKDPDGDSEIWIGTWSVVSGTGRYAGLKGSGGVAGIIVISGHGLSLDYFHRYEGYVTRS